MKIFRCFLFLLCLSFFFFSRADYLEAQQLTNKFGIHILSPQDLGKAQKLVNSNGGDWGFVTIVIRDDEMDFGKWQNFFDECRERHLIPLVRIATHLEGSNWVKPQNSDIEKWSQFLGNLNWPIKERYVIIYNEPNHAKEWGGEVNPADYAQMLNRAIDQFKQKNLNFQILNSGFDQAAPNSQTTMDTTLFWQKMEEEIPGIFQKIDGWVSHSYPNHGFIGTPFQSGRHSIKGYQWETHYLETYYNLKKNLPIFITETGWPYKIESKDSFITQEKAAEYIKHSFEKIWPPDVKIRAVTPFLLYYDQPPFENFSWITKDKTETLLFQEIENISKNSWWPEQEFAFAVNDIFLPSFLPVKTAYRGTIILKNKGQSIWGEKDNLRFTPKSTPSGLLVTPLEIANGLKIKPENTIEVPFIIKATAIGEYSFSWEDEPKFKIKIFPASTITRARYNIWEKMLLKMKKMKLL